MQQKRSAKDKYEFFYKHKQTLGSITYCSKKVIYESFVMAF